MIKKPTALLLAGTGAMGIYLIEELLSHGYSVDVTTRSHRETQHKDLRFIQGDAGDDSFLSKTLQSKKYDVIVDFMVYSTNKFRKRHNELLSRCGHYIYLSSYRVFADTGIITEESPRLLDVSKDDDFLGTNDYSLEKARQEDILTASKMRNWTIVRPAITYSRERFQLGTLEADTVVWRSMQGAPVILAREMLNKFTTMTWAGDVARILALLAFNEKAFGEDYNVATNEHHTWRQVARIYTESIGLKVVSVDKEKYIAALGGGHVKYQVNYDRMFNRVLDNTKVLEVTGVSQESFTTLSNGLKRELKQFVKNYNFKSVDYERQARIDLLTHTVSSLKAASDEEKKVYTKLRFPRSARLAGAIKAGVHKTRARARVRTRLKHVIARVINGLRSRLGMVAPLVAIKSRFEQLKFLKVDGAILTLPGYYNYGNIIQRYALQKFLSIKGYNFISYVKNPPPTSSEAKDRIQYTSDFIERNIRSRYFRENDVVFKRYIVGSDQVWRNWGYHDVFYEIGFFFLKFTEGKKVKRIAYAASIGQDSLNDALINEKVSKYIKPLVGIFDSVSMRESSGVDLVDKEWGVKAHHVLDPTLLLEKKDYDSLIAAAPYRLEKTSNLFTYFILTNDAKRKMIDKIKLTTGYGEDGIYLERNEPLPPVEWWLKSIRDAEIMVTDSFHGMVFSILNNTSFVVLESGTGGSDRVTSLLDRLGIKGRYIKTSQLDDFDIRSLDPIDWKLVNGNLDRLRSDSGQWLLRAIKK